MFIVRPQREDIVRLLHSLSAGFPALTVQRDLATPLFTRALVYLDTGQAALAQPQAESALEILQPILGEAHYQVQVTRCVLAEAHRGQGNEEQAWQLAGPALEGILAAGNATPRYEQRCRDTLINLADAPAGPR